MEAHRDNKFQRESSESLSDVKQIPCKCDNFINVGLNRYPAKVWVDDCDVHGVGTSYFQAMKVKPYGYRYESKTTRAEWLAYLVEREEEQQIEYENEHYYDEEIEY